MIFPSSEVGIYKENKKIRTRPRKLSRKKESFFFFVAFFAAFLFSCFLGRFLGQVLVFFFSYFLVFFYKFPPLLWFEEFPDWYSLPSSRFSAIILWITQVTWNLLGLSQLFDLSENLFLNACARKSFIWYLVFLTNFLTSSNYT